MQKLHRVASLPRSVRLRSKARAAGFALVAAVAIAPAAELARGAFDYSADVLNSDLRNDTMDLIGNVRLAQDAMSIEAAQAHAAAFRSDNSRWSFERSVRLQTAEADLRADVARAAFVKGQIASARVEGAPAQFEQRGSPPDRQVRGRAGVIEYDFVSGIVTLTGDVRFSYGKDLFCGDTVIYSIRDERVRVNPNGGARGRVKGTIQPREGAASTAPPSPDSPCVSPGNGA
jgi:lipopolysaccharide transport protein LptA